MATLHGKNSRLYMNGGTGDAEPVAEAMEWSIDVDFDTDPDPALGDDWETRLKGLMRFSGSFSGNFDDAQDTLFDAAISETPASFYLYPAQKGAASSVARYYYGTIWPKVSLSGGVSSKISDSVSFEGQGPLAKNPA